MMYKNYFKIAVFVVSIVIVLNGCKKGDDDEVVPDNPTNGKSSAIFNPDVTYGTVTDQDGNIYKTVTIGTQIWMAENLRTLKYNDGTPIPNVEDDDEWVNLTTGAFCNYNNSDNIDTIASYGRLYNWYAVHTGNLAPEGWHVATDEEWAILINYLGGYAGSGNKIKETGTTHFYSNDNATNEVGFTALPAGNRGNNGIFGNMGFGSDWWTATSNDDDIAWGRGIHSSAEVSRDLSNKVVGFSVRCVKD